MAPKKRILVVDMIYMISSGALLIVLVVVGWDKYLFRFPFLTLLLFYYIGKWARDYELKLMAKEEAKRQAGMTNVSGE